MEAGPPPAELPVIPVTLRDGLVAELRPIRPDDRDLVAEGFARLSAESRFARFGSGLARLSSAELAYLTDVDQVNHVAWGATIAGKPAGAGRFIRLAEGNRAEVAITVVDTFQGRGLGRHIFDALVASARAVAVDRFSFSVQPGNPAVLRMIRGIEVSLNQAEEMVEGSIDLADVDPIEGEERYVTVLDAYRAAFSPRLPPGPIPGTPS